MDPNLVAVFADEEIDAHLQRALDSVERLDPPADLRVSVFGSALAMVGQYRIREGAIAVPRTLLDGRTP